VKDYPIFVPVDGDHLASILTVPDAEPRGLVALFQGGGGAPRSYYNSMWTVAARELAGLGFAASATPRASSSSRWMNRRTKTPWP
jgi:hypothetical protein